MDLVLQEDILFEYQWSLDTADNAERKVAPAQRELVSVSVVLLEV